MSEQRAEQSNLAAMPQEIKERWHSEVDQTILIAIFDQVLEQGLDRDLDWKAIANKIVPGCPKEEIAAYIEELRDVREHFRERARSTAQRPAAAVPILTGMRKISRGKKRLSNESFPQDVKEEEAQAATASNTTSRPLHKRVYSRVSPSSAALDAEMADVLEERMSRPSEMGTSSQIAGGPTNAPVPSGYYPPMDIQEPPVAPAGPPRSWIPKPAVPPFQSSYQTPGQQHQQQQTRASPYSQYQPGSQHGYQPQGYGQYSTGPTGQPFQYGRFANQGHFHPNQAGSSMGTMQFGQRTPFQYPTMPHYGSQFSQAPPSTEGQYRAGHAVAGFPTQATGFDDLNLLPAPYQTQRRRSTRDDDPRVAMPHNHPNPDLRHESPGRRDQQSHQHGQQHQGLQVSADRSLTLGLDSTQEAAHTLAPVYPGFNQANWDLELERHQRESRR